MSARGALQRACLGKIFTIAVGRAM